MKQKIGFILVSFFLSFFPSMPAMAQVSQEFFTPCSKKADVCLTDKGFSPVTYYVKVGSKVIFSDASKAAMQISFGKKGRGGVNDGQPFPLPNSSYTRLFERIGTFQYFDLVSGKKGTIQAVSSENYKKYFIQVSSGRPGTLITGNDPFLLLTGIGQGTLVTEISNTQKDAIIGYINMTRPNVIGIQSITLQSSDNKPLPTAFGMYTLDLYYQGKKVKDQSNISGKVQGSQLVFDFKLGEKSTTEYYGRFRPNSILNFVVNATVSDLTKLPAEGKLHLISVVTAPLAPLEAQVDLLSYSVKNAQIKEDKKGDIKGDKKGNRKGSSSTKG